MGTFSGVYLSNKSHSEKTLTYTITCTTPSAGSTNATCTVSFNCTAWDAADQIALKFKLKINDQTGESSSFNMWESTSGSSNFTATILATALTPVELIINENETDYSVITTSIPIYWTAITASSPIKINGQTNTSVIGKTQGFIVSWTPFTAGINNVVKQYKYQLYDSSGSAVGNEFTTSSLYNTYDTSSLTVNSSYKIKVGAVGSNGLTVWSDFSTTFSIQDDSGAYIDTVNNEAWFDVYTKDSTTVNRQERFRLTLETKSTNYVLNQSEVHYKVEVTGTTGTGCYEEGSSYWLRVGVNDMCGIADITYQGQYNTTQVQWSYPGKEVKSYFYNKNWEQFYSLGWDVANTYATSWLSNRGAGASGKSILLEGDIIVYHDLNGSGTAKLYLQVGKPSNSSCHTDGHIKSISKLIDLPNTKTTVSLGTTNCTINPTTTSYSVTNSTLSTYSTNDNLLSINDAIGETTVVSALGNTNYRDIIWNPTSGTITAATTVEASAKLIPIVTVSLSGDTYIGSILRVSATPQGGGATSYQWYYINNNINTDIVGQTGSSYTITSAMIGYKIGCKVTVASTDTYSSTVATRETPTTVSSTTKVWKNDAWHDAIVKVYKDGSWKDATVKVYKDGSWK